MWHPTEKFYIKSHIAGSLATLVCAAWIVFICLVPSFLPGVHRLLLDDRISTVIPYLLFLALGGPVFSIWYLVFRKSGDRREMQFRNKKFPR
ncbi:MAG: hypothetical protein PHI31_18310 [Desulfuromonadaceae bacterium]|nr:hypothetical protein [Desulfuromonadaceae bacterium]